jgi:hypothetical protein
VGTVSISYTTTSLLDPQKHFKSNPMLAKHTVGQLHACIGQLILLLLCDLATLSMCCVYFLRSSFNDGAVVEDS